MDGQAHGVCWCKYHTGCLISVSVQTKFSYSCMIIIGLSSSPGGVAIFITKNNRDATIWSDLNNANIRMYPDT